MLSSGLLGPGSVQLVATSQVRNNGMYFDPCHGLFGKFGFYVLLSGNKKLLVVAVL